MAGNGKARDALGVQCNGLRAREKERAPKAPLSRECVRLILGVNERGRVARRAVSTAGVLHSFTDARQPTYTLLQT